MLQRPLFRSPGSPSRRCWARRQRGPVRRRHPSRRRPSEVRAWLCAFTTRASHRNFQGTFVVQRRRQRRQRAHRPFLRRAEPVRADRVARRPAAPGLSPQRRRQHALAGEPRRDDRAARPAQLLPGAAAGAETMVSASGTRCRPRAGTGSPGTTPTCSSSRRATPIATAIACGPTRTRACCFACDVIGEHGNVLETSAFSDVRDRRAAAAREHCRRRCPSSTAIASSGRC